MSSGRGWVTALVSLCAAGSALGQLGEPLPGPRPAPGPRAFVTFESDPVRPLALSPDGSRLFAANIPAGTLEIFELGAGVPVLRESVPVGLEPVAVAALDDERVFVVNHLSDSVSVVDVSQRPARVVRTLLVGDEPRDVVFAGPGGRRAFVTTAHRGQNSPVDPQLTTPGVGRADVWVFEADDLGSGLGGSPTAIVTLFGDTPRSLAATPDGARVFASIYRSGNGTTSFGPPQDGSAWPKDPPHDSADGVPEPSTGVILRFDGAVWRDGRNEPWPIAVPFTLPDLDVFELDAMAARPGVVREIAGVGTTLLDMAVNPVNGALYVANLDARNAVRFSGRATRASTTVRGWLVDHRITVVRDGAPAPRFLNKHLDFTRDFGTADDRARSLSLPMGLAVSGDGGQLYVSAFGSSAVGVFDTAELEEDRFVPDAGRQIALSGGGPCGLVLDERRGLGYALTRFDMGLSVIDLAAGRERAHLRLFDPEPASVVEGRPFQYDARFSSSRGADSCGVCHLFGDSDGLAWDLGDPDGETKPIPNSYLEGGAVGSARYHPLKGPMVTQSMRGLVRHGPMHWRGDRTGAGRDAGETLEEAAFREFAVAFEDFFAREGRPSDAEMHRFAAFAMELSYPPNPIRSLDDSLTARQQRGRELYERGVVRRQTGRLEVCARCHPLDPARGVFGTEGLMADNGQPGERNFKIPHFRDQYQKVGMFGFGFQDASPKGRQVRGFGYNHDGATSSNFVLADLGMPPDDLAALRDYLLAFPTGMAPITGQQVTLSVETAGAVAERLALLVSRARVTEPVPECDLVASGVVGGEARGWLMLADGTFRGDRAAEPPLPLAELERQAVAPGAAVTFTCAPWGSGERMGIDRDLDGVLNGDAAAAARRR